jgi:two-component system response regulator
MNKKTILLIEDNSDDIVLTKRAFARHGFHGSIETAESGIEALDYLFCRGTYLDRIPTLPDLILLDLNLPKPDGLEVLKEIRKNVRTRFVPVVILTSSSEESDVLKSYQNGANSFLQKPVDFDEFVKAAEILAAYWLQMNKGLVREG